ncbi:hypothetical protein ZOSMA_71G00450 [Zostera marina]|uniref:Pentatricopeptide repeat-containing protein n=1 Tax=Zostera marina TaxID=29655 RepID=A0A0K9NQC6_ZOSMR|nr:hypothetical protein ZOSMA_71G00450 [Zostera marina]
MFILRRRRRFHDFFSSFQITRRISTDASSLENLFQVEHQSDCCGTSVHLRQPSNEQQSLILSKWCERSKLSATAIRAIIQREPKCRRNFESSGSAVYYGLLIKGEIIDKESTDVLIEIAEAGVFPSVPVQLGQLITKLCKSKFVGKAWDFFHIVKRGGCLVGTSCCNALLTGLHETKDFAKMNLLFSEMKDWGMQPDKFTNGILLDYLCKSNRVEDARKLFDKMASRTSPSAVMSTIVVNGLCMEGRLEDAMKFLSENNNKHGLRPNTLQYNHLIKGYCRLEDIKTAKQLLVRMKDECVPLDIFTVNTLIDGMCRNGQIASALEFFREQYSSNIHFSGYVITYNILIGAFLKVQNIGKAMNLYDEMRMRGHKPNIITYTIMVSGLSADGCVEKACSMVSQMRNEGFIPQLKCYNSLISGFSKMNRPDKMYELLDEMETTGVKPNVATYTILISFSANKGDISTANQYFDDMLSCGFEPNIVTYGALILCYCKSGKFNNAMKIFRNMLETGFQPDNVIYSTLFNHLSYEKNVGYVLSLLDEMRARGVSPNTITYNTVFKCLCRRNALEDAYELMNVMKEEGCNPDYYTYMILTNWFSSAGEIHRLKKFIH